MSYRACVSWCQYNGAQHDPPKYVNHHRLRGRQGPETANQKTQSGWWSNHKPMKSSVPLSGFLDHDQNLNNFLHSLLYKIRKIDKIPCCASSKIHLSLSWNHSAPFKNFWLTYNCPFTPEHEHYNLIKHIFSKFLTAYFVCEVLTLTMATQTEWS